MPALLRSTLTDPRPHAAAVRHAGPHAVLLDAEPDDPLVAMVREVGRDLAADAVLVTWHEAGREPTALFATGIPAGELAAERDMLIAATEAAATDGGQSVRWAAQGGEAETTGLLVTRIPAERGVVTVTSAFRLLSHITRHRARAAALRALPVLQAFFRLWAARARALVASRGLKAALDSSDVAILLVDRDARLGFVNRAADRLIARNNGLRRAGPLLSATRLGDAMRLQAAIEHVVAGDAPGTAAPVVALHRKGARPLLAAVVAAGNDGADSDAVAAIVQVVDPDQDIEGLLDPVCRLYGLSPVEGRLATLLAGGAQLADAAKAMGIQEQTARSYLKQIFLKTDTNRQAELVWLMLKSAVRTAPGCRASLL